MAFSAGQKIRASDLNKISAPMAKYSQNTAQTMTNGTNVKMQFPLALETATDFVTAGGTNNDTFTAVLDGDYFIEVGIRCATAGALPELGIYQPGNVAFAVGNVKGGNSAGARSCSAQVRLALTTGATFAVNCFNNGTTSNIDTAWGSATHISIRYEGPGI